MFRALTHHWRVHLAVVAGEEDPVHLAIRVLPASLTGVVVVMPSTGLRRVCAFQRATSHRSDGCRIEREVGVRASAPPGFEGQGIADAQLERAAVAVVQQVSDQQLADHLFISASTAATHVRNIMRKTEVKRRSDLTLLAVVDWHERD